MKKNGLTARFISAIVLAPPVIAALYVGFPYFDILALIISFLMAWEWSRMVGDGKFGAPGIVLSIFVVASLGAFYGISHLAGLAVAVVGGGVVYGLLFKQLGKRAFWFGIGNLYIALPILALIFIRQDPKLGLELIFWLVFVVWATDVGAYAFGRTIGGPKVMPSVSPKKTWAGLIGGMICAALIGYAASYYLPVGNLILFVTISGFLAVIAQVGDFFESGVKRKFGVKDSSNLIPGHGGILDRVDGLLPVAIVAAVLLSFDTGLLS
ncbi:MAG: phosphatidate cytidylyltransferase [Rhodospirillales bacterium]|nr:phosphatidate cytidylyltransferase [Rhodospirillales bacterium]